MKYRKLGKNGPEISAIGFGSWAIGGSGWQFAWGEQDDADSIRSVHKALDLGINFFDTAAAYGLGHSEEILGKALSHRRTEVVLATKCGLIWDDRGMVTKNGHYDSILREAEASLRRLNTDYIDLYQMHWPDTDAGAPLEETMRAMDKLVQDGLIRYVGVSNYNVAQMKESMKVRPIDSLQPPYSLFDREVETEILPFCEQHEIGVVAYSPLASGLLSGTYDASRTFPNDDWRSQSPLHTGQGLIDSLKKVEALRAIANEMGATVPELAAAYVLANSAVTSAIIGVRKESHITTIVGAADIHLDGETLGKIRAIFS